MNARRFLRQIVVMAVLAEVFDILYHVAIGVIFGIALIAILFGS